MRVRLASSAAAGVLLFSVTACGGSVSSADPSTNSSSADTVDTTSSTSTAQAPDAQESTYRLTADTVVKISREGSILRAAGGSVTVTGSATNGPTVAVVATDTAGISRWTLDVVVTARGRVESGELVEGGRTWVVLPQTGLVTAVGSEQTVDFQTDQAVTVRSSPRGPNVPVTFRITGVTEN